MNLTPLTIIINQADAALICFPDLDALPAAIDRPVSLSPVEGGCQLRVSGSVVGLVPLAALSELLTAPEVFFGAPGPEGIRFLGKATGQVRFTPDAET